MATETTSSTTIALDVPAATRRKEPALQDQLQQIINQRGHFRFVNEKILKEEIAKERSQSSADLESFTKSADQSQDVEQDSAQQLQEKLWKSREDMLAELAKAQNDVLCALDFVSLVLAKQVTPAQASMSPALKEAVPIGSVEGRVLPEYKVTDATRKKLTKVSQGWRLAGFQSASEKLSAAAQRLDREADRESRYWKEIANLKEHGWVVSRLPRDSKTVGVHFGFAESAPQFRNRGFAPLEQDQDENIQLKKNVNIDNTKRFQVAVVRNSKITGSFVARTSSFAGQTLIGKQLIGARNAIFEEELFFELGREARLIANQGITTRSNEITVDIDGNYQILLCFGKDRFSDRSDNSKDDSLAEFIGLSLQTLLSQAHDDNLARRSQPPPAMRLKPRTLPEYQLIRPLAARLMHRNTVTEFMTRCTRLTRPLHRAGLTFKVAVEDIVQDNSAAGENMKLPDLRESSVSNIALTFPSAKTIHLRITTDLRPPILGMEVALPEIGYPFATLKATTYTSVENGLTRLHHALILDLVSVLQSHVPGAKVLGAYGGEVSFQNKHATVKAQVSLSARSMDLRTSSQSSDHRVREKSWTWSEPGLKAKKDNTSESLKDVLLDLIK